MRVYKLLHINIISLSFLLFIFFVQGIENEISIFILEGVLCLFYFYGIIWGILYIKKYPLALIMISLFGVFIYSRFILDFFDLLPYDIKLQTRFIGNYFSEGTIKQTLIVYIISITGLIIGFVFSDLKSINCHSYKKNLDDGGEKIIFKLGILFLILSIPGLIYKMYYLIEMVNSSGYLALYKDASPSGIYRVIEFISYKLYILGVCLLLSCKLSKKVFYIIAALIIIISLIYLFLGKRGDLGISVIFLIWYWFSYIFYRKKITKSMILGIITLFFILITSFQFVNYSRSHQEANSLSLLDFIASQGVSGTVLPYYLEYMNIIDDGSYPYILAPIMDRMNRGEASVEVLNKTNYLGYELTYAISPNAYLDGEGVGTSFIAELYEGGYLCVFLGMLILGYFVVFFEKNKMSSYLKFISMLFFMTLLFLPRGELFEYFYELIFFSLLWCILDRIYVLGVSRKYV
ncbi:O-antigen polysaccharide polymerase Wzy [Gallibacterium sp. AGMB14963]|uniref:O-antigen polysaccharide polymerase Wzy n=1 Tax=Gallibacterium faecale TaxID=3019086 RepID=UPI0022F1A5CD|nr:O-antigen polysaccharide polymerase Wzy [Gallibacterium sp. AGMB14963]MDA3978377.1 O-antigen polysaccharide polymerase Wzy [Gallibacterium sp. AGMB14963]